MTDDLRALAEQIIAGTHIHPSVEQGKALLGLLDERDGYKRMLDDLIQQQLARERRVAALEEGLRALIRGTNEIVWCVVCDESARSLAEQARALLERSDPPPALRLGQQVAAKHHLPRDLAELADAIERQRGGDGQR